jgi:hypothetical protein
MPAPTQIIGDIASHNFKMINKLRAWVSLVSGIATGILGFQGLSGFLFYGAVSLVASFMLIITMTFSPEKFFPKGIAWQTVVLGSVLVNFPSFLMAWVLAYGICFVY